MSKGLSILDLAEAPKPYRTFSLSKDRSFLGQLDMSNARLTLLTTPKGTFVFVGSVPAELSGKVWKTADEAKAAARKLGHTDVSVR
jgi:hypothetical protein